MILPAYETKNIPILDYRINGQSYALRQSDSSGETGSTLWLSTQVLAAYFSLLFASDEDNKKKPRRRQRKLARTLELGSGIGLLSLVLRDLGVEITASDYDALMPLLRANIDANPPQPSTRDNDQASGSLEPVCLDWTSDEDQSTYDTIVMADVIYAPTLIQPLHQTLLRHCKKGSVVYLAQEVRTPELIDSFLALCAEQMKVTVVSQSEMTNIIASLDQHHDTDYELADQSVTADMWSGVAIYKMVKK